MNIQRCDVAIVGGGISGLVAGWKLAGAGQQVVLLESGRDVGGSMQTEFRDGFILEKGPFNVLVRDEAFHALLDDCGDALELVRASKKSRARFVLKDGALHQVPAGPGALLRTPLLSVGARLRLLRGLLWSAPGGPGDDGAGANTIHAAAARRFGPEVAETFVSALVAGIFGGDSRALSLDACFPKAAALDRRMRSPLGFGLSRAVAHRRARGDAGTPKRPRLGLVSFRHGLGALPHWLAGRIGGLGGTVCTETRVTGLERAGRGFRLQIGAGRDLLARRVILATPGAVSGELVASLLPRTACALSEIPTSSLAVVNLGFRREDVGHPMAGYGFLVPAHERAEIMGVLWASSAFPHHAPEDRCLLRVFMGGPRDPDVLHHADAVITGRARRAVTALLDVHGAPVLEQVCRWPNAIPQYGVDHPARVKRITEAVRTVPGLRMIGNALRGVSINDCVREATTVAEEVLNDVTCDPAPDDFGPEHEFDAGAPTRDRVARRCVGQPG